MLLEQLLDGAPGDLAVQVEVKAHGDPALARATAAAACRVAGARPDHGRVAILSFHTRACERQCARGCRRGWWRGPIMRRPRSRAGRRLPGSAASASNTSSPPWTSRSPSVRWPQRQHRDRQRRHAGSASRSARRRRDHDRSTSGAAPRACRDVVGSLNDADRNARSSRGSQHREDPWVADLPLVDDLELVEADDPP